MRRGQARLPAVLVAAVALAAAGCTSSVEPRARPAPATTASARDAASPPPVQTSSPEPAHPVSIQALMQKEFDGRDFTVGRVLARNSAYTRHFVTYGSGDLTISGIMNVPSGAGPFPVLILLHGYIDPEVYTTGRGLRREQDYLARRGYVVVHPDYRNHAQSDDDPRSDLRLRLGYAEDVVNAIEAIRRASLPYVDPERVGILGRSMGGGVALVVAVVRPDLADAIVLYAPVSSDAVDNFERWTRGESQRRRLASRIVAAYGSPEENPEFWRNVSPATFFDRIAVPIIVHHGTADDNVPFAWSSRTVAELRRHGKDVRLFTYEGERHAFSFGWLTSIRRTATFFNARLGGR